MPATPQTSHAVDAALALIEQAYRSIGQVSQEPEQSEKLQKAANETVHLMPSLSRSKNRRPAGS